MSIRDWIEEVTNPIARIIYSLLRLPAEILWQVLNAIRHLILGLLFLIVIFIAFGIMAMAILQHQGLR
jgi:hypothetical protein